jgi:glycosyltransferase involved in cell wall biosynthesis
LTLLPSHQATLPKILFLSLLHEKKGVDILIRAAAQLRDAGQSFVLLIAGTGEAAYKRQLLDLTAKLNLTDHVHFLGLITGSQKLSLYQLADIFVLPTFQENFGLVLAEALACGTPVITTRGTDLWPHIQEAGGLITDATPAAFAAAISKLLASPDDLPALGRRGRAWVFDNLAQDTIARRSETLYRELAHPRATTP